MIIDIIDGRVDRYFDEDIGLSLFKFYNNYKNLKLMEY